ncbi:glycosyltransferase family 2 protein [Anaerostipes hadrus]|uniref:glycosyltransferase family 2 protein n=1 Tax=Anaerostipes hadrus TaxID=649756 RepID=UPI0022E8C546|nr:glycosyltransferase [Anaerostipes hadrus]
MGTKILSVIIPVYNAEKYIANILKKFEEQKNEKIEIILVDDGSRDKSLEICKMYADRNQEIKVFHQSNFGASSARNKGIQLAEGRYIVFVDSDDDISDGYVKTIYEICENIDADIIQLDSYTINKGAEEYNKFELAEGGNDICEYCKLVLKQITNPPWNKIYKAEIIQNNNIAFDTGMVMGEDISFTLDFLKYAQSVYVCHCAIYKYIKNSEGLCSNVTEEYLKDLDLLYNKMLKFMQCRKFNMDTYENMNVSMLRSVFRAIGLIVKNGGSSKKIRKIIKSDEYSIKKLLDYQYFGKVDNFRRYLINMNLYNLISLIIGYKNS